MGALTRFDLAGLIQRYGCSVFIETGTGVGDSLAYAASCGFSRLLSVEVIPALAAQARRRFSEDDRVQIICGESVPTLATWLAGIAADTSILFWLDAHFPGADYQQADYAAETHLPRRLPLEKELSLIHDLRAGAADILLVDDLRIYRDGPFENGNIPPHAQTLTPAQRNTGFLNTLLAGHRCGFSMRDEGYIIALPASTSALTPAFADVFTDGRPALIGSEPMNECGKACLRRMREPAFLQAYFRGRGLDIGGALDPLSLYREFFPLMQDVSTWDWEQGDAQYLHGVDDESYDFVHSSHCLEHMRDPAEALVNWFRVVKPGGHLVVLVPDEDLYEQGGWPSTFNGDHKVTFTVRKARSWSPASYNLLELICNLPDAAELKALNVLDASFRFSLPRLDQTMTPVGECAIELVIRKRTGQEIAQGGRLPLEQRGPVDAAGITEPANGEAAQVEVGLVRANAEANRSAADEATEATIRRLEHQAQSLQAALHAIETSRTWRLSEPLRRWGTRVKQIAGKLERG